MQNLLKRSTPLYRQISSVVEKRILSGELNAGDQLPNTKKMAQEFGVTVQTAQQAAALLCKRGLVERTPGRGSFISQCINSRTIGIVCGTNIFGDVKFLYFQKLYAYLCLELKREGWNTKLYFPFDDNSPEQMLAELRQDMDDNRLRGVIKVCASPILMEWFKGFPAITVEGDSLQLQLKVEPKNDVAYRGVDYLLGCGYRRIAVLMHSAMDEKKISENVKKHVNMAYEKWGMTMQATFFGGKNNTHALGREHIRRILDSADERPEAFLMLNDMASMGSIFELLCHKLDIPGDVGVMAVSNKGVDIPCPVSLTRLEHDPKDKACREIENIMSIIEDREPEPVDCSCKLIVGKSCGE